VDKVTSISIALVAMVLLLPFISHYLHHHPIMLKRFKTVLLVAYGAIYLYLTLFNRTPGSVSRLELTPFWSYQKAIAGNAMMREEIILNILLFVPLGFLLCFSGLGWWKVALIGVCLSSTTEVVQYLTRLGLCELDDLISNGLGTMIGVCAYHSFELVMRKIKRSL